jgi:hypothetical protein
MPAAEFLLLHDATADKALAIVLVAGEDRTAESTDTRRRPGR